MTRSAETELPLLVNAPMAARATRITAGNLDLFDEQAKVLAGWHETAPDRPQIRLTASAEESKALNQIQSGAIILSASGMCDAWRIRHHLRHNLPRREPERALRRHDIRSTVVVFGSARMSASDRKGAHYLDGAWRFAAMVSRRFQKEKRRDFVVVTGGGPGIMEAA